MPLYWDSTVEVIHNWDASATSVILVLNVSRILGHLGSRFGDNTELRKTGGSDMDPWVQEPVLTA